MNVKVLELIEQERKIQDEIPGNSNNHSDAVWIALLVKQLGQIMDAGQRYIYCAENNFKPGEMNAYYNRYHQVVQATALMVAWLEDIVTHEPLE